MGLQQHIKNNIPSEEKILTYPGTASLTIHTYSAT
jgi:hypothetical protein